MESPDGGTRPSTGVRLAMGGSRGSALGLALGLGDAAPGLAGTFGGLAGLPGSGGPWRDTAHLGPGGLSGGIASVGMFDGSEGLLAASCGLLREGNSQWDLHRGRRGNDNEGRCGGCFLWFRHDRNLTRVPGLRTSSLVGNTPWEGLECVLSSSGATPGVWELRAGLSPRGGTRPKDWKLPV